jgi:microcystin-dependent protein
MSEPFLAEIRVTSFNFAPKGWALCNGQILPISQNQALFSLLGTTYGGDGRVTFALPDLRGRVPTHLGATMQLGERAGEETATLLSTQMPAHSHAVRASGLSAASSSPAGNVFAKKPRFGINTYAPPANPVSMNPLSVSTSGGGQPHENMQPYLVLNFIIALQGIFPPRD